MRIVLIHGRSQEDRSADELKDEWLDALNKGLARLGQSKVNEEDVDVPYYGNLLRDLTAYQLPDADEMVRSQGVWADADFARFMAEAAAEISLSAENVLGTPPDPDTIVRTPANNHAAYASLDNDDDLAERGPQNWPWVVAVVRHIDRSLPGLSTWSIGRLLRDVYVYITDKTIQQKIDGVVEAALGPGPTLVVSHSLGTVVAYNVLRKKQWNVSGLITLGSPLGIRAIRQRLEPPSVIRPAVGPWTNLYDEQDIVALNPLNTAHFAIFDPSIMDVQVDNGSENHHNITPYLSHLSTAKHIQAILANEADK